MRRYWCLIGASIVLPCVFVACSMEPRSLQNYQQAREVFWQFLYPSGGDTLYCQKRFGGGWNKGINIEHVFPMAWATNGLKCGKRNQCRDNSLRFNQIEADLHNLYPTRSDVNKARASFRFGEIGGESRQFGQYCDFEVNRRARVAEPRPAIRGDVARAMLYMAWRYENDGLMLFRKQRALMQKWHQQDPPSKAELERNDKIERLQGNRNPYIDNPTFSATLSNN